MLTRRRFLGYSATSILAATAGCRPQGQDWLLHQEPESSNTSPLLSDKIDLAGRRNRMLGYPVNMKTPPEEFFAWQRQLNEVGIGAFNYNNVGNPFNKSTYLFNTHDFERDTILNFGELFSFLSNNTWGFVSHSGTDSNMHGMYMGRTVLKSRTGKMPKAYFTKEAHYSIEILRDLLGLETVLVETQQDGGMDPDDLRRKLNEDLNHPALVVATIGTTFKGAIDPVDRIQEVLQDHTGYLHLDAALFGGFLPYTSHADEVRFQSRNPSEKRYDSIAVSCHKFFGFPSPAGLFITTENNFSQFNELFSRVHNPEYIHQVPGTITCSRDAVKPAEFYFHTTPSAREINTKNARSILHNTAYLLEQMQTHFPQLQPVRTDERSNIVYFRKPGNGIVKKFSLATMQWREHQDLQDYAHVVVMPHVNRQTLDEFLTDLDNDATV